ncbi:MAG: metal-dependent transcriptional regulator [Elusimicrobiota bacterium]
MSNRTNQFRLTSCQEDCLEALYELSKPGPARLTALSVRLSISKPSASSCLERLERAGYVMHDRYAHFTLTPAGLKIARGVSATHALLHRFLSEILKVPSSSACSEACALEHAFTPATLNRLRKFMGKQRSGK